MCKGPEVAEKALSGRQRCCQQKAKGGRVSLPSAALVDPPGMTDHSVSLPYLSSKLGTCNKISQETSFREGANKCQCGGSGAGDSPPHWWHGDGPGNASQQEVPGRAWRVNLGIWLVGN